MHCIHYIQYTLIQQYIGYVTIQPSNSRCECFLAGHIIISTMSNTFMPRNVMRDPDCPCRVVKTKTFVYDCILYEGRVRGCHVARVANGAKTPTPPCCSSATTKKKAFRRAACRRRRTRAPNRQRQPQRAIDNARRRRPVRGGDARTPMRKCTTTENTAPPRRRYSSSYRPLSFSYTHHRTPRPKYYNPKFFLYFLETNTLKPGTKMTRN